MESSNGHQEASNSIKQSEEKPIELNQEEILGTSILIHKKISKSKTVKNRLVYLNKYKYQLDLNPKLIEVN